MAVFFSFYLATMLQLIRCYGDGTLLDTECHGMNINHGMLPQGSDAPFTVEPDITDAAAGQHITVELRATSSTFNGFMLNARKCEDCEPAGTFSLTDTSSTVLLPCYGQPGRAVSHSNNLDKYSIIVNWSAPEAGTFYFRAAFTQSYSRFWLGKSIELSTPAPTTTTQRTTTASTTAFTTGTDAATTTAETNATNHAGSTTITTAVVPPSPMPVDFVYTFQRCVLALLLFSRLCFLGGSSVMLIKPVLKAVRNVAKIQFVLESASKIIAFILLVIRAKKYPSVWRCAFFGVEFTALTGIAMVLSLLHTITIFLYCGPSHELRKCWLYAVIVFHLLNSSITTAAIFVGVWCFQGRWLPILMGVYVIWEILLYMISHRCDQVEKQRRRNTGAGIQNHSQKRGISQMMIFGFFSVLNIMFTIALITGVSVTLMVMGRFPGQGLD